MGPTCGVGPCLSSIWLVLPDPQARRDKTKTRDYRRQATVEERLAAEACLKQIDLAARKREECKKNPEPRGRGMTRRADKFFCETVCQGERSRTSIEVVGVSLPGQHPRWMTFTRHWMPQAPAQRRSLLQMMTEVIRHALTSLPTKVDMIRTGLVILIHQTERKGATGGNVRKTGVGTPLMPTKRRTNEMARWCCLYSGTPLKKEL